MKLLTGAWLIAFVIPFGSRADLGPLAPVADLHRAVHESLGLPEPLIVQLLEKGLPEPELPAIGWIAQQTRVPVQRVADLRLQGVPLLDITLRLGGGPEIFYVPFDADPGPPYGKAWGYYKKTPRADWRTIRLLDLDIVNLTNLHLVTRHYSVSTARVLEMQRHGNSFSRIHKDLANERRTKAGKSPKGAKEVRHSKKPKGSSKTHPEGGPPR